MMRLYCRLGNSNRTTVVPFSIADSTDELKQRIGKEFHHDDDGCGTLKILTRNKEEFEVVDSDLIQGEGIVVYYPSSKGNNNSKNESDNRMLSVASLAVAKAENDESSSGDDDEVEMYPPTDQPMESDDDDDDESSEDDDDDQEFLPTHQSMESDEEDTRDPFEQTYRVGDKCFLVWSEDENEIYPTKVVALTQLKGTIHGTSNYLDVEATAVPDRTGNIRVQAHQLRPWTKAREDLYLRRLEKEKKETKKDLKRRSESASPASSARKKQKRGGTCSRKKKGSETVLQAVQNDDKANEDNTYRPWDGTKATFERHQEMMYEHAARLSNSDWKTVGRLAGWIEQARCQHRAGKLTIEKQGCLDQIGFFHDSFLIQSVPSDRPLIPGIPEHNAKDERWNQSFKSLQEIGKVLGNYGMRRMYDWAQNKRNKFERISGRMNEAQKSDYERFQALQIFPQTGREKDDFMYEKAMLLSNHISSWDTLRHLESWIGRQHHRLRLTVEKQECLDQIGFFQDSFLTQSVPSDRPLVPGIAEHSPNDEQWNRSFKLLQEIGQVLGNYSVRSIYNWGRYKRKKFENISGGLTQREKTCYERLQALGVCPYKEREEGDDFHESMYEKATLLLNHISDWNTLRRLARWIENARDQRRCGRLTVERRECLERIGFFQDSFLTQSVPSDRPLIPGIPEHSPNDEHWNRSFKSLQEIGKVIGNYRVSRMYDWPYRERKKFEKISGRMNETQKADYERFQALGICPDVTQGMSTMGSDSLLRVPRGRHDDMYEKATLLLNHISSWDVLRRLGNWIDTQQRRSRRLTVERRECLERIGFFRDSFLTQSVPSDRPLIPGIPEHSPNDESWNLSFQWLQAIGKVLGNYGVRRMYYWAYRERNKLEKISGRMNETQKSDYERFQALGIFPDVPQEMTRMGSDSLLRIPEDKNEVGGPRVKHDAMYEKAELILDHISSWDILRRLTKWIYKHRSAKLTVEKRQCLERIGFFQDSFFTQSVPSDRPLIPGIQENKKKNKQWNRSFKLLQEIGKVLGNYRVKSMYDWAFRMRKKFETISECMNETEKSAYERFQALGIFPDVSQETTVMGSDSLLRIPEHKNELGINDAMYEKAKLLLNHISSWDILRRLGHWICNQRRSGRLTVEKRECLERIGFFQDSFLTQSVPSDRPLIPGIQENKKNDEQWNRSFTSLQEIGKVIGNYGVKSMYDWACRVRKKFEKISGCMNETEKSAYERFQALGIFPDVTQGMTVMGSDSLLRIPEDRNELGNPRGIDDAMYEKAKLLMNQISSWDILCRLGNWICDQRRSGRLTVEKRECLERIGFFQDSFLTQSVPSGRPLIPGIPEHSPNDESWNRSFKSLQEIGQVLGNYGVRRMYYWAYHERNKLEKISGRMNETQKSDYERFQALGIFPDVTQEVTRTMMGFDSFLRIPEDKNEVGAPRWKYDDYMYQESMYEQATLFSEHISDWMILGQLTNWISDTRGQHWMGELTVEKRACLEQIGFFRDSFSTESVPSDRFLIPGIQENSENDEKWNRSFKLLQEIGELLGNYGVWRIYYWAYQKSKKFEKISGRMNETEKFDYERFQALKISPEAFKSLRRRLV